MVGHCYATLISEGSSDTWYIVTCEGNNGGTYKMDHLIRVRDGNNLKWKHLPKHNLLNLHIDSVIDCKIKGEWNVSNERSITFLRRNPTQIDYLVEQMSLIES